MYKIIYNNSTISTQKQNNNTTSSYKKSVQLKYLKLYNQSINIIEQKQQFLNIYTSNNIVKIYIKTTLNNMFITYIINDKIITKSVAALGFKGKAKQTRYAYKTFAETIINDLLTLNNNNNKNIIVVNLYLNSLNKKLKPFFTLFKTINIKINKIYDLTPLPYNGCRKRKISIKKKKKSIIKYLSYK